MVPKYKNLNKNFLSGYKNGEPQLKNQIAGLLP